MRSADFLKKLLGQKKEIAKDVVLRICKIRGLPIPSINFDYCPNEDENQLAHYHPDTNIICISQRQLIKLNFDDIEKTMAHEVTHQLEKGHDTAFRREEVISSIASFRSPPGTVMINLNKDTITPSKTKFKKSRIDKTRCNYHLCRKKKKLNQCPHCGGHYCSEHIQPKQAGMPRFHGAAREDKLFMEEWRKAGHPCAPYVDYEKVQEDKQKKKDAKFWEELREEPPHLLSEDKSHLDKTLCHYHLCKKKTELVQCSYCKDYYCSEHIRPKQPGMPRFHGAAREDKLFMDEWRKEEGHPCASYFDHYETEREEQKKKEDEFWEKSYINNVEKLRSKPTYVPEKILSRYGLTYLKRKYHDSVFSGYSIGEIIILLLMLMIIAFFLYIGFRLWLKPI